MRGGREMENHFECLWDLFRSIPSIETPGVSVLDEYYWLNKEDPNYFKLIRLNFSDETPIEAFLEEARSRSLFDIPVEVNADDQLLSLVTCSYSMDDGRFIILCRKLRADETPEQMSALLQQAKSK